jgi:hypothetical protein
MADEFSSKLPIPDLYGAPRGGEDSNLHWYKYGKDSKRKNETFQCYVLPIYL